MKTAEQFLVIACSLLEFKDQERLFILGMLKKNEPAAAAIIVKKPGGILGGFFGKK